LPRSEAGGAEGNLAACQSPGIRSGTLLNTRLKISSAKLTDSSFGVFLSFLKGAVNENGHEYSLNEIPQLLTQEQPKLTCTGADCSVLVVR
jgi:hypothetical protein